jgi:hypothetical protein
MLKKHLNALPLNRLLIYLTLLGFLPLFFTVFHYSKKKNDWDGVAQQILNVQHFTANVARKQATNRAVRAIYRDAEQFYLENQLEPLVFLKKEKEALEHLLLSPTFTGNEAAEKRHAFLTSNSNRFEWIQGSLQASEGIEQADVLLAHSVEIDANDLKEILMRIEGSRKAKPQLIITDFKLNKKELSNGNEVFELNMKLLKREFHP